MSDAGRHMRAEIAEAPAAFVRAVSAKVDRAALAACNIAGVRAFYTIARGSSDAAANILSYEFMRETGKPMTSLPPSIFSVGRGVAMTGTASIVVSQSGASDDLVRSAKGARAAGGVVIGIVNQPGSAVESAADLTQPMGAGPEPALKLKETCALHAEAYSSSEVLHGPLQLVSNPLLVLILDTGQPDVQASLDVAEARFRAAGGRVHRIRPADVMAGPMTAAAAAALLPYLCYPLVLATSLALGHDPDHPANLSKVTQTT